MSFRDQWMAAYRGRLYRRAEDGPKKPVFVYGTLMRGERNHRHLSNGRAPRIAQTVPAFTLYDLGPYPAMVAGGADAVHGELYEVDAATLVRLDQLEGHPSFYRRELVTLADRSRVFAYVLRPERLNGHSRLPSGDWRKR